MTSLKNGTTSSVAGVSLPARYSAKATPSAITDIQKYFRDVADHLARVQEQVIGFDELLNSILQANLAQASVAQNEDMRKITSWAAIIAVPTMVCGVYGMNFDHMPELHTHYGYAAALGLMALSALGTWLLLRWKRWL